MSGKNPQIKEDLSYAPFNQQVTQKTYSAHLNNDHLDLVDNGLLLGAESALFGQEATTPDRGGSLAAHVAGNLRELAVHPGGAQGTAGQLSRLKTTLAGIALFTLKWTRENLKRF